MSKTNDDDDYVISAVCIAVVVGDVFIDTLTTSSSPSLSSTLYSNITEAVYSNLLLGRCTKT